VNAALRRATNEWRAQFRGDPPIKDDVDVTKADVSQHNLVLWGDPQSNKLLGRMIGKLPLRWNAAEVRIAGKSYNAVAHIPVLIYLNPLNLKKYVVLNSGFTFAEQAAASNARQTPRLPEWAAVAIDGEHQKALGGERRGGDTAPYQSVVEAGFFDEEWQVSLR
jgi:hypothetical protein